MKYDYYVKNDDIIVGISESEGIVRVVSSDEEGHVGNTYTIEKYYSALEYGWNDYRESPGMYEAVPNAHILTHDEAFLELI